MKRSRVLKLLEKLTALRGEHTMVRDLTSAAILSKTIAALYRKLNPDYWKRKETK